MNSETPFVDQASFREDSDYVDCMHGGISLELENIYNSFTCSYGNDDYRTCFSDSCPDLVSINVDFFLL